MSRVEIASMPWGVVQDRSGNAIQSASVTLKNLDGSPATHWSAATGGSSSTSAISSDVNGTLAGRFIDGGQYLWTSAAVSVTDRLVDAVSGSVESGVVSPRSFQAFTNPIQEAVDAATAGEVVEIDRNYTLPATLTYSGSTPLKIRGRGHVTIDFSTVPKISTVRYGLKVTGSVGSPLALTADAAQGAYSVTLSVPDAATLAVGDWVQLSTTGANYYGYAGGVNVDRGEIKKVRDITSGTVTFEQAVGDAYATANTAQLRKVTFVEDVHITGVKFKGPDVAGDSSRALELDYVNGFSVHDCVFEGADIYGIATRSSIRGDISHNRFRGTYYDGVTGSIFYGIANLNSSQWIRVHANHGERIRHLWVCSSDSTGQGFWGSPSDITVVGNVGQNAEAGGAGRSWMYEHHGFGHDVVLANNTADGCYGGIAIRGPGIKVIGNKIKNWHTHAIEIHSDMVNATDIQVEHNTIRQRTVEGGGAAVPRAIIIDLTNATAIDLIFDGNKIDWDVAGQAAVEVVGAVDGSGLQIKDTTIRCSVEPSTYVVSVTPSNVLLERNKFYGTSFGIICLGASQSVVKNFMLGVSGATAGEFIRSAQATTYVEGNVGRTLFIGLRLLTGANNSVIANNLFDAATDARAFFFDSLTGVQASNNRRPGAPNTVTAASTIVLPVGSKFVVVSGTTAITSITAVGHAGEVRVLRFSSSGAQVTDGGNLKLAGNLTTAAVDGTLTLYCDGTNFYELARSAN